MRRRIALAALLCGLLAGAGSMASAPAYPSVPARASAGHPVRHRWHPRWRAAIAYARHRRGIIAFAVRTERRFWGYHAARTVPAASVLKAMLLVTYLNHAGVRGRALGRHDRALLVPMITRSDDTAAQRVFRFVGRGALRGLARRVGMRHFYPARIWGRSRIDASDQTRFFLHIDLLVVPRHRATALHLLASIIPSQRWGIGRVRIRGWKRYFKGGWGAGTGWVDHQVVLLKRGQMRFSVAVLTHFDPNHAYGKATLKGLFGRLLRGLGPLSRVA